MPHGIPAEDPVRAGTFGAGRININNDYNWDDCSNEQLGTLIIIHELGHQPSSPNQPSDAESAAEKLKIAVDCIQ